LSKKPFFVCLYVCMTADNDNTEILLIFFGGEYVMKVRQVTVIERGLPCTHLDVGHSQILR